MPDDAALEPTTRLLAGAVRVVSGLTGVSRVLGLARDVVSVRVFGDSAVGSAFAAAFAIPNTFRRLFGEGALSAAFVPEYARLVRQDPAIAGRFASLTVGALALVTGLLTIAGEGLLLTLIATMPPQADRGLSLRLLMVTLPFMPLVCVAATLGGMLHVWGRFAVPAAQPVVLNVLVIAAAATHFLLPGRTPAQTAFSIGWATVAAGALQVVWSLWTLRTIVAWTTLVHGAGQSVRRLLRRFLPALIGLGATQLNVLLDTLVAMWPIWIGPYLGRWLYPLDTASAGILFFTQRLYQFPLGVFGIAVATAVFPLLARHLHEPAQFGETLRRGIRLSVFIGLPASIGLFLVREPLVAVLYAGGHHGFSAAGVERSAAVLAGYGAGVWIYSLNHVLTRALYARGDMTGPMRIALVAVAANLVLNITLIWPMGEAGLAWSTAATALVQLLALWRRQQLDTPLASPALVAALTRIVAAAAVMALLVWLLMRLAGPADTWPTRLALLAVAVVAGTGSYLAAAGLFRCPELRWLLARSS